MAFERAAVTLLSCIIWVSIISSFWVMLADFTEHNGSSIGLIWLSLGLNLSIGVIIFCMLLLSACPFMGWLNTFVVSKPVSHAGKLFLKFYVRIYATGKFPRVTMFCIGGFFTSAVSFHYLISFGDTYRAFFWSCADYLIPGILEVVLVRSGDIMMAAACLLVPLFVSGLLYAVLSMCFQNPTLARSLENAPVANIINTAADHTSSEDPNVVFPGWYGRLVMVVAHGLPYIPGIMLLASGISSILGFYFEGRGYHVADKVLVAVSIVGQCLLTVIIGLTMMARWIWGMRITDIVGFGKLNGFVRSKFVLHMLRVAMKAFVRLVLLQNLHIGSLMSGGAFVISVISVVALVADMKNQESLFEMFAEYLCPSILEAILKHQTWEVVCLSICYLFVVIFQISKLEIVTYISSGEIVQGDSLLLLIISRLPSFGETWVGECMDRLLHCIGVA